MVTGVNQEQVNDTAKLMIHRLIARAIRRDPSLIDKARSSLDRSASQRYRGYAFVQQWDNLLCLPPAELRRRLTSREEEMTRLRLSSPFVIADGIDFTDVALRRRIWRAAKRLAVRSSPLNPQLADCRVSEQSSVRTFKDLVKTVTAIAKLFNTDKVFIIGSQSILLSWPDAPIVLRTSGEIDAYPENARIWEITHKELDPDVPPEASEEINALFGEGSGFHRKHGFFIDGVDENTARLPAEWKTRAIYKAVDVDGRSVLAVAPCPEDVIVSKLARLSKKDEQFAEAYHAARPLDLELIVERIKTTTWEPELRERAIGFVARLRNTPQAPSTQSTGAPSRT